MTTEQAQDLQVGDVVRDVTCGRKGTVVERTGDSVRIAFDRMRPDGGEWLGNDEGTVNVSDCDFLALSDKRTTGLYGKFRVERTDGKSAAGEKHDGCEYFVLDLTHDPFAMPAIAAYRDACRQEYPALAADLAAKITASSRLV